MQKVREWLSTIIFATIIIIVVISLFCFQFNVYFVIEQLLVLNRPFSSLTSSADLLMLSSGAINLSILVLFWYKFHQFNCKNQKDSE